MSDLTLTGPHGRTYFSHDELACKHCGQGKLAPGFGEQLLRLRIAFDRPMWPTSCCRCAVHNKAEGGHARSLHVFDKPAHKTGGTCAIDVAMIDGVYAHQLLSVATQLGWSVGINFARSFIHLDRRIDYGVQADPSIFSY